MNDKKLVLDVSGKDRAAISVMHAYMRLRGFDPDDLYREEVERDDALQQDKGLRQRWMEKAQELANNPESRESFYSTACLATEHMVDAIDEKSPFHPTCCPNSKNPGHMEVAAVLLRSRGPLRSRLLASSREWFSE